MPHGLRLQLLFGPLEVGLQVLLLLGLGVQLLLLLGQVGCQFRVLLFQLVCARLQSSELLLFGKSEIEDVT